MSKFQEDQQVIRIVDHPAFPKIKRGYIFLVSRILKNGNTYTYFDADGVYHSEDNLLSIVELASKIAYARKELFELENLWYNY